ncbi:hypothetical protein SFR_6973 (plasmid) [Streptomyces sp. FR-008]|nr:hypothetical protein SFR_6973 [Streptomyces sp. FR-008]
MAGCVDRPDEDASDQGFASLGLGFVEGVGEVRGCVVVEGTSTPGAHADLLAYGLPDPRIKH